MDSNEFAEMINECLCSLDDENQEKIYIHLIMRSNLGIRGLEEYVRTALKDSGREVGKVERVWAGTSPTGAMSFEIDDKVLVVTWIQDKEIEILSVKAVERNPMDDMYDDMGDTVSSGVLRIYSEKLG